MADHHHYPRHRAIALCPSLARLVGAAEVAILRERLFDGYPDIRILLNAQRQHWPALASAGYGNHQPLQADACLADWGTIIVAILPERLFDRGYPDIQILLS